MVDKDLLTDLAVPCHILFGRPREFFFFNDHLLFQINYVKIKQNFNNLYGNWFLEAINFHKVKNMLIFLKALRYLFVLYILTLFNCFTDIKKGFEYISTCKFDYLFMWFVNLAYYNCKIAFISSSKLMKFLHLPVIISFLYANVFLTKESVYIFIGHLTFGYLLFLLNDNKSKKPVRNRVRLSGGNVININNNNNNVNIEQDILSDNNILLNGNN